MPIVLDRRRLRKPTPSLGSHQPIEGHGELDVEPGDAARVVGDELDPHLVVDVGPFRVVVGAFGEQRRRGHEAEGLCEAVEDELLVQLAIEEPPPLEVIDRSRKLLNQIYMDPAVREYIVNLVGATRYPSKVDTSLKPLIRAGASPRASINLALASRARAFMEGRAFVTPQDVKTLTRDVLRHRILLSYEAEAEDMSPDMVIERILTKVPVP